MEYVTSCSLRILWNGKVTDKFKATRGVRQGDPLSPYLFVACMDKLAQLVEVRVQEGSWTPFPTSKGGPKTASLFFADDVVRFMR